MTARRYPAGAVRALLGTDLLTPRTREVLLSRLEAPVPAEPRFLDAGSFAILHAACARLIPQPERQRPVDLAGNIDERLAGGKSDGWRYDRLPPDGEAYRRGLRGLDETSRLTFGRGFTELDGQRQDEVLKSIQGGAPPGETWEAMPADRFFEELLAELTECYYSDPLSQEEIGYAGMADAKGWRRIGLDQLEPWEPRPVEGAGE